MSSLPRAIASWPCSTVNTVDCCHASQKSLKAHLTAALVNAAGYCLATTTWKNDETERCMLIHKGRQIRGPRRLEGATEFHILALPLALLLPRYRVNYSQILSNARPRAACSSALWLIGIPIFCPKSLCFWLAYVLLEVMAVVEGWCGSAESHEGVEEGEERNMHISIWVRLLGILISTVLQQVISWID